MSGLVGVGRGIFLIYDIRLMNLHADDIENITIPYTLDIKVGYSDVATLHVIGEPEDNKADFQYLPQAIDKILKSPGMQNDH